MPFAIDLRRLTAITVALLAVVVLTACGNSGPVLNHAELEWEMRHEMPTYTPAQWNAWEAELASALDQPEPDPPMFPEAAAPDEDGESDDVEPGSD